MGHAPSYKLHETKVNQKMTWNQFYGESCDPPPQHSRSTAQLARTRDTHDRRHRSRGGQWDYVGANCVAYTADRNVRARQELRLKWRFQGSGQTLYCLQTTVRVCEPFFSSRDRERPVPNPVLALGARISGAVLRTVVWKGPVRIGAPPCQVARSQRRRGRGSGGPGAKEPPRSPIGKGGEAMQPF